MRIIPVIDLLGGQAVHAVKGRRSHYQPVKSVLCNTPDPVAVARSFRDHLGLSEIYIADLDAILGFSRLRHQKVIHSLAHDENLNLILDAGVSDIDGIRTLFDLGVSRVVIGAETLSTWNVLREITAKIECSRLIFSLDLRDGKILSQCPRLSCMTPLTALEELESAGWQEVLLLDLKRVGSREGVDRALITDARARVPSLRLLAGGGISDPQDIVELKCLGIAGVLAATAFHDGCITAAHVRDLHAPQ